MNERRVGFSNRLFDHCQNIPCSATTYARALDNAIIFKILHFRRAERCAGCHAGSPLSRLTCRVGRRVGPSVGVHVNSHH